MFLDISRNFLKIADAYIQPTAWGGEINTEVDRGKYDATKFHF
jgi:hypothetical protein